MNNRRLLSSAILILLTTGVIIVFTSFINAQQQSLASKLIGQWRNVYVKILIKSKDKTGIMEADSSNWEDRLGIRPIRTYFKSNGTYHSEYLNLSDDIFKKTTGTWTVKGDSLTMTQLSPEKAVYKYQFKIENGHATFKGMIDFDGDGLVNDEYLGIKKKYR